ncbi:MAG: hypothetical protein ABL964_06250 [Steroidobacteraceae bacterium]
MKTLPLTLVIAFASLSIGRSEGATAPQTIYERLAAATSLECRFTTVAASSWENGVPKTEVLSKELKLTFGKVNVDEGTADANSQFGDFYVAVRFSNGYLHLMQMFSSGPLYVTTVMARETADGRMMAIHTRHEYTPATVPGFTSRPETYFGDCAIGS